ncbi:MAG TPA: hypothetical protein VI670_28315 [Thermoanaerobaculia bacterium]|jgi:hypothetical protein
MFNALRRLPLLIVAIAFLVALEPVVHSHPAAGNGGICAVCAAGPTQLPTTIPAVAAPAVIISVVAAQPISQQSASVALPLASRAPPAA